ncbi:MAG: hypothetical protein RMI90_08910 [Thermoguttaceae bacterium]|nr:hypothetical protein [Thermoguttaceae bacterium]
MQTLGNVWKTGKSWKVLWVGCCLLGLTTLVSSAACAQNAASSKTESKPNPAMGPLEEFQKMVTELKGRLDRIEKSGVPATVGEQNQPLEQTLLTKLQKEIEDLKQKVNSVDTTLDVINRNLNICLLEVGRTPLPLRGENISIEDRQALLANRVKKLEEKLNPVTGRLVVENYTGIFQTLRVNGRDHVVPPGETTLLVSVQDLEAYLPYQETPKTYPRSMWREVAPGQYEFVLHIRPRQPVIVGYWPY